MNLAHFAWVRLARPTSTNPQIIFLYYSLFNQLWYKFYPQSILILEEYLLKGWNANLIKCLLPSDIFWSNLWKMGIQEGNIKLLLENVTYITTTETVTCIITIKIVMCIMHCGKYYLHDCNRDSHVHNNCSRKYHWHNCNKTSKSAYLQQTFVPT